MKLFWREHIPLIIMVLLQLFLVLLVYRYDGYTDLRTALYAVFLGLCLLAAYMIYRYFSHRIFYERLSVPPTSLQDSVRKAESAAMSAALNELMESQYRHYQQELKSWERKQQEHLTFMNQWVHQMKTPLSVIELIVQEEDDPRFSSISEESDRLRRGLEMVLYMARLDTFEQDFHIEKISLRDLVKEVVHENKRYFIRSCVYPDIQVEAGLKVETDAKWLRFALQQLLTNAIKYSAGTRTKVSVAAYPQGREVILEVRDLGPGIPKQDLPRVFHPFFTGVNGRKFKESTGMGLYLVKQILERLNHTIVLESEAGTGTTARVVFPYGYLD
ncbi:HAMP domain-containing sensor histidine kinase [Paenibacillus sp. FJAT-26967]|uniref:sensor histidine kinase n=1 Tax=Paenibacillus sp. FJAT-26967 TaxID=1729690 RepID=UPI0008383FB7|nr:sensor histidine kinase [Paenibacillus sp. FJAT-26967]